VYKYLFIFRNLQKMWNPSHPCWDALLSHRWALPRTKWSLEESFIL
jgi:hypothetical protein